MALANKKIISFRNVTKEYPNGVLGLKDLNIERCWVVWCGEINHAAFHQPLARNHQWRNFDR